MLHIQVGIEFQIGTSLLFKSQRLCWSRVASGPIWAPALHGAVRAQECVCTSNTVMQVMRANCIDDKLTHTLSQPYSRNAWKFSDCLRPTLKTVSLMFYLKIDLTLDGYLLKVRDFGHFGRSLRSGTSNKSCKSSIFSASLWLPEWLRLSQGRLVCVWNY